MANEAPMETTITISGPVQVSIPNATSVPPSQEMAVTKIAYSVIEAAAAISMSERRLRDHIKWGDITVHQNGKFQLILHSDLVAFVQGLPTQHEQAG